MDKLGELLNILKENKLDKTYNRIMTDLADIKSALSVVNEEVNDSILGLLAEGKYAEVGKLSSIPIICSAFCSDLDKVIKIENINPIEVQSEIVDKEETIDVCGGVSFEAKLSESVVEMDSSEEIGNRESLEKSEDSIVQQEITVEKGIPCVTSMKDLRIGVKVLHRTLGVGYVEDIEDSPYDGCKLLCVSFDMDEAPRKFNFMPATLSRHFVMDVEEDKIDEVLEYKNIVTSTKGLKIGAKLMHKLFGLGEVLSIEYNEKEDTKILTVQFENEENPKKFSCTDKILEKYFGIGESEKDNIEVVDNKSVIEEDFQKVIENYNIALPKELKSLLHKVETIILRQDKNVKKLVYSDYYRYDLGNKPVCKIGWGSKFLTLFFTVPDNSLENKKGLLRENRGHHIRGNYKLKIDRSVSLEDVEYYIVQAFKVYK